MEPPVEALALEEVLHGLSGGLDQSGLLEFQHLVRPVAGIEPVVEVFPAAQFAVVVGDELADVGRQQRLGGLAVRHGDPGPVLHHAAPEPFGPLEPYLGGLSVVGLGIACGRERIASDSLSRPAGSQTP